MGGESFGGVGDVCDVGLEIYDLKFGMWRGAIPWTKRCYVCENLIR